MYSYRYINRHYQFGETNYSLILEDLDSNPVKSKRIEKTFRKSPEEIDDNFLYEEARKEILIAIQEDLERSLEQNSEEIVEE